MRLIIDIPESIIEHIKDGSFGARPDDRYMLVTAVLNGTSLPTGHGRLIDADRILDQMRDTLEMQELYLPIHLKELIIDEAPTIIEANKEEQT